MIPHAQWTETEELLTRMHSRLNSTARGDESDMRDYSRQLAALWNPKRVWHIPIRSLGPRSLLRVALVLFALYILLVGIYP